jgi:ADP-heptose:LPS heptosyltransferase
MPDRILLIQLRRIGDVLMTTPAAAALRKALPRAHLALLVEAPSHELYRHNPDVDEVILWPRPGVAAQLACLWRLRGRRFDVAVDFLGNSRSALIARLCGAPRRIGYDKRGRRAAYTEALPIPEHLHYAAAHKLMLAEALGAQSADLHPRIYLGQAERDYASWQLAQLGVEPDELLVALSPVSRRPYKVWPAERFARLADALIERYRASVLFVWGPGEAHFVEAVRSRMRLRALPDYPLPRLPELAALLERCHLYVGNDNGPRHLAVAVGTPTMAVFGKPLPENWTLPNDPRHRFAAYDPGCKRACSYPRCDHLSCINGVTYEAVEAGTERLLEALLLAGRPVQRRPDAAPA